MRKRRSIVKGVYEAPTRYEVKKYMKDIGYNVDEYIIVETERGTYVPAINGLVPDRDFIMMLGGFERTWTEENE